MKKTKHWLLLIATILWGISASAADLASGTLGTNLTWKLSESRELRIEGVGEMVNYELSYDYPWADNIYLIYNITIGEGVTSIGNYAFESCSNLKTVNFPSTLTNIGGYAFRGCSSLDEITIPSSVTTIGTDAFYGCSNLTKVNVSCNWESTPLYTFKGKYNRNPLVIGDHSFENGVCTNCGASSIITGQCTETITYTLDRELWKLTLSGTGETPCYQGSDSYGKYSAKIKTLVIEDGITSVGEQAFASYAALNSVSMANSVTSIGRYAFADTGLTSIELPNSVTTLHTGAFFNCRVLKDVKLSEGLTTIETDSDGAFQQCVSLTSIELPASLNSTGPCTFADCSSLSSVILPQSITSIGFNSFARCTNLITIDIPQNVTTINGAAFQGCSGLKNIVLPSGVTSIGGYAFDGCSSLKSIILPNGVTSIGNEAFNYCSALIEVVSYIPAENLFHINEVFYGINSNCVLKVPYKAKATYEDDILGWNVFSKIVEMTDITLEEGVEFDNDNEFVADKVTYVRTLPNQKWNALYLPFEVSIEDLGEEYDVAFINDIHSYDTDGDSQIDNMEMEIIRISEGTLMANYPYMIKAKSEEARNLKIEQTETTLYTAQENTVTCSSVLMRFDITGTYAKKTQANYPNIYAINTSGAWSPLNVGSTLNPYRLYLTMTTLGGTPVKVTPQALNNIRIRVQGEDTTTEITQTITDGRQNNKVYDLSGRQVILPQKGGIYIKNGKKVIL